MMNRRPKINDQNIKLIEKVIKRQNLTAQQDSRQHHNLPMSLIHHQVNSTDETRSPQLIIKNSQYKAPKNMTDDDDESSPMMAGSNYVSDRIEKALQKYSKKDISVKSGQPSLVKGVSLTRNGGLFPSQVSNGGGSANTINQVQKIYCSTLKGGASTNKSQQINSNNSQTSLNNHNMSQQQQQQSPYLNQATLTGGVTIYNQKQQKGNQNRLLQKHQQLPTQQELFDEFRSVNSYSVDRVGSHASASKAHYNIVRDHLSELSFDNHNNYPTTNTSFTNGMQDLSQPSPSQGKHRSEDYPSSNQHIQLKMMKQPLQQLQKMNDSINTASTSFTHSNQKRNPISYEDMTPPQYQSSPQPSFISQPLNNNYYTYGVNPNYPSSGIEGQQDLFFDDNTNHSTIESIRHPQNNQQLWSQQMLLQHQQQQYQLNQVLVAKLQGGDNGYTKGSNQMSPLQYLQSQHSQQQQYSKSRDGGYRNIPMRDHLNSINADDHLELSVQLQEQHPFKRPKLHLFKKDPSRRIKTSSATRNLQPIYPLEGVFTNNKLFSNNFNSINIGGAANGAGTTTSVNPPGLLESSMPDESQQSYNSNYCITKNIAGFITKSEQKAQSNPQSKLQTRLINHLAIPKISDAATTIETTKSRLAALSSIPADRDLNVPISINNIIVTRPSTTHIKLVEQRITLPPKEHIDSKQSLKEEINGFKHSFYNEKNQTQFLKVPISHSLTSAGQLESQRADANITQNTDSKDCIKQIFILNVNATLSNNQSLQESKAMTPCFIHTPNMTNKWNDFKPPLADSIVKNNQAVHIHHQSNPSDYDENSPSPMQRQLYEVEPSQPLFIRSKVNDPQNDYIEGAKAQIKKPMTSHQSASKNDKISNKGSECIIKLLPQDIYLQSTAATTVGGTTKGSGASRNSQTSINQKPQTSGSSFRRPLSRNHPMLNLVSRQQLQNVISADATSQMGPDNFRLQSRNGKGKLQNLSIVPSRTISQPNRNDDHFPPEMCEIRTNN